MNRSGMDKLLGDKFTLGADASVAAGPVGRTAERQYGCPNDRRNSGVVAR